jgi:hypothetical protein
VGEPLPFSSWLRVDSTTANVLSYTTSGGCSWSTNESLQDSFKARLHDSIRYNCQPPAQYNAYVCTDTNNTTVFGVSRQARSYTYFGFEDQWVRSYAKGIGLYAANTSHLGISGCMSGTNLRGCVINGILYGDTSMLVGIKQISTEIPENYALHQNYPNPFNSKSKIKFQIAKFQDVKLIIYDALGKKLQILVNEELQPGTYEVEWDGTNFPSGIYYYRLTADDYSQTKKMVLIR